MDDDKAVEVICTFVNECMMDPFDATLDFAHELLAALRAAGGEIVWWKPLEKADIPLPLDVETVCFPFGECNYDNITNWCILRGPEVKK